MKYSYLIFYLLLFTICCVSYRTTARYDYKLEEVKGASDTAMKKIKYDIKKETEMTNDKEGFVYFQKFKYLEMKFRTLNGSTIIQMTSNNERVPLFIDDIITQELNKDYGHNQLKTKKSFWLNLILDCISPVFGWPYAQYKNPYYSRNSYLTSIFVGLIFEAYNTWLFGTKIGRRKLNFKNAISWRWIWPAATIIASPFIYIGTQEYNNLVKKTRI